MKILKTICLVGLMNIISAMDAHAYIPSLSKLNYNKDSLPNEYKILYDSKSELLMIQWKGLNDEDHDIRLTDKKSALLMETTLLTGSTIAYFDTQTLHAGDYYLEIKLHEKWIKNKITITK